MRPPPLPTKHESAIVSRPVLRRVVSFALLAFVIAFPPIVTVLVGSVLSEYMPPAIAYSLGALCGLLFLYRMWRADSSQGRSALRHTLRAWWTSWRRRRLSRDLNDARQSCGREGTLHLTGDVTLWTDVERDLSSEFESVSKAIAAEFASIFGEPPRAGQQLRVLVFRDHSGFIQYSKSEALVGRNANGWYSERPCARVIVSHEVPIAPWNTFHRILARELARHFMRTSFPGWLPYWCDMGLYQRLPMRRFASQRAPGTMIRFLQAEQPNGTLIAPADLEHWLSNWSNAIENDQNGIATAMFGARYHDQCEFVVQELFDRNPNIFQLLCEERKRSQSETFDVQFERVVGTPIQDFMASAFGSLAMRSVPPHAPAPADVRQQIDSVMLPKFSNPDTRSELPFVILAMGRAGYVYGADALVQTLNSDDFNLRDCARFSLRSIAGTDLGPSPEAWRRWLDGN